MPKRMAALVFIFVAACGSEQPPLPQVRSPERITFPPTQEIRVLLTHEKAIEAIHSVQGAEHYTIRLVRIYQDWSDSATADVEIAGERFQLKCDAMVINGFGTQLHLGNGKSARARAMLCVGSQQAVSKVLSNRDDCRPHQLTPIR
jgi:hypothetical protein